MPMISEFEILRDIDRRIAELQNTTDRNLGAIQSEFRLFRQETIHYRNGMVNRLKKLEERANKPAIDIYAIMQNLWFKVAVLMALGASNKELFDLVAASFAK